MTRRIITFHDNGELSFIGDQIGIPMVVTERKRASFITPMNPAKWIAFHGLRFIFGERGRVAEWTRRWKGPWRCRLVGSNRQFIHPSRQVCVEWELQQLNK